MSEQIDEEIPAEIMESVNSVRQSLEETLPSFDHGLLQAVLSGHEKSEKAEECLKEWDGIIAQLSFINAVARPIAVKLWLGLTPPEAGVPRFLAGEAQKIERLFAHVYYQWRELKETQPQDAESFSRAHRELLEDYAQIRTRTLLVPGEDQTREMLIEQGDELRYEEQLALAGVPFPAGVMFDPRDEAEKEDFLLTVTEELKSAISSFPFDQYSNADIQRANDDLEIAKRVYRWLWITRHLHMLWQVDQQAATDLWERHAPVRAGAPVFLDPANALREHRFLAQLRNTAGKHDDVSADLYLYGKQRFLLKAPDEQFEYAPQTRSLN